MPYTDQDEADLKKIASGKSGFFSAEYKRQYRDAERKQAPAKPANPDAGKAPKVPFHIKGVNDELVKGEDAGELGKKWQDTFTA